MKNAFVPAVISIMALFGGCLTDSGDDKGEPSPPDIAVTPVLKEYGDVFIGQTASQTFTVSNAGEVDLAISSTGITGQDHSEFTLTAGGNPVTVVPGGMHEVTVRFSPKSAGAKSAALSIECNDPDESPLTVSLAGYGRTAYSAATYMAFHEGAQWVYRDTITDYGYEPPEVSTVEYTTTCTGQETFDGKTYWAIVDSDSGEPAHLRTEGTDVYGYDFYWDESEKPAFKALRSTTENLILRFGVPVGTIWDIWSYTAAEGQYSWSFTMTGEYAGTETVTVPGGTFEDCAKINITTVESYYYDGVVYDTISLVSYIWFAPNIGPVKTTEKEIYFDETLWSYESLMLSYVPVNEVVSLK